jgi:lactaldehyde dehydrogenase / glycolaldehyde dehydrogenase
MALPEMEKEDPVTISSVETNQYDMYIDGQFHTASEWIEVENPSTRQIISRVAKSSPADVNSAVAAAEAAQGDWAKLPAIRRAQYLQRIAAGIRSRREHIAQVISEEQGKILSLSLIEVDFSADYLDYMAGFARRYEGSVLQSDRIGENILLFKAPIGVVAGILPWNFPFFLIVRKVGPALVAGNTIVIKPSEETPNNAGEFARIVAEAELPKGVFNLVNGYGHEIGPVLAGHKKIGMVSLTGSVEAGTAVMHAAALNITKVSLELGGKAPAIVMSDADLDLAVAAIRDSRTINTGQVCNCAERVYVHESVADEFLECMKAALSKTKYGDPFDAGNDMGPLVNSAQLKRVDAAVKLGVSVGCELLLGGSIDESKPGYHYKPTLLANCPQDSAMMQEEVFGPVLPVATFSTLDEALALANDCEYGLTSSIFTRDLSAAMRAANELKFGETYVNREHFEAMQGFHAGWRKSGIGGADGRHGLDEYLQTRVVYLNHDTKKQ